MEDKSLRKKKWIAVGSIALLSTCFSFLMQSLTNSIRNSIIEHKNLGEILVQIEDANIDKDALSSVLRESPPLIFIFIASLIGTAFTIWLYHKILGYLCAPKKPTEPNEKNFATEIQNT